MKVLSLFDGISCGMVALERAGIRVDKYVAYEIDDSAIKISKKNYPQIEHCGDVFAADFARHKDFDLLIGGSPCTHWSIAQKSTDRETTASGIGWELFSQYVRALKESGCRYFLYENNKSMSAEIKAEITKHLGVEPLSINSSLLSAQNRQRLYWTNIPGACVPSDKGVLLKDIIESGTVDREKALCIARRYAGFSGSQSYLCRRYFGKSFGQAVFEGDIEAIKAKWKENPYFESDERNIRQMTVKECERLQTLPDDYTDVDGVSTQTRYEAIGNGWTVDVIAWLLKGVTEHEKNEKPAQA
jgi:site-specific DNA-cytosine methylase